MHNLPCNWIGHNNIEQSAPNQNTIRTCINWMGLHIQTLTNTHSNTWFKETIPFLAKMSKVMMPWQHTGSKRRALRLITLTDGNNGCKHNHKKEPTPSFKPPHKASFPSSDAKPLNHSCRGYTCQCLPYISCTLCIYACMNDSMN